MYSSPVTIESLVSHSPEFNSPPEVFLKVNEQLENEFCSAKDIGDTVEAYPAIATRILGIINSAYYKMPGRVSTITEAVSLLGRDRFKHLITGMVLMNFFKNPEVECFSMQEFWQHSIKTAIFARQLAVFHQGDYEPDAIFVAGLLHDIGQLVLVSKVPEKFAEIERERRKRGLMGAEWHCLGFDHAEVGAALMTQWGLPDLLVTCTRHHHDFDYNGQFSDACRIIYIANNLSHHVPPLDEDEAHEQLDEIENWRLLGVSFDEICYSSQYSEEELLDLLECFGMVNNEAIS